MQVKSLLTHIISTIFFAPLGAVNAYTANAEKLRWEWTHTAVAIRISVSEILNQALTSNNSTEACHTPSMLGEQKRCSSVLKQLIESFFMREPRCYQRTSTLSTLSSKLKPVNAYTALLMSPAEHDWGHFARFHTPCAAISP